MSWNRRDRFVAVRYSRWWFGIADMRTPYGPLMLHQPDLKYREKHPDCPRAIKLVLFKKGYEADELSDELNRGSKTLQDLHMFTIDENGEPLCTRS